MKRINLSLNKNVMRIVQCLLLASSLLLALSMFAGQTHADAKQTRELRVISTDAFVTDIIVALSASDSLVGVDVTSTLPASHPSVPNIGYHRNLSAEGLLSLNPSVVIGSEHIGPPHVVTALQSAKVPLIQLHSATTIDTLQNNIERIAITMQRRDQAELLKNQVNKLERFISSNSLSNQRIAFLLMMDESAIRIAGAGTNAAAFISLLGAHNVANFQNYQSSSIEALISMQPTLVLVAGREPGSAARLIERFPVLKHSEAYASQRIVDFDSSSLIAGLSIQALYEAKRLIDVVSPRSFVTASPDIL
jgi:heme transport system substrate-binding protein